MKKLYPILASAFSFIRQFLLPNPFEPLGEGITITLNNSEVLLSPFVLNLIAGFIVLPIFTYLVVGIFYRRNSNPSVGCFLYMGGFVLHSFLLRLMSWAYPSIWLIILIFVAYIVLLIIGGILFRPAD